MSVKRKTMLYIILIVVLMVAVGLGWFINLPKFGRAARGERLERIESSPNYRNGVFHNLETTPQLTSDKNRVKVMFDFMFEKRINNRPTKSLPAIKTDFSTIDKSDELLVWFGHSSYFIQSGGKRMLIDPVFEDASPLSIFNKPFKGTDIFRAKDMPDIDYLIITHDHWDHLDHKTVSELKNRVSKIICPLGVGEHLEYWGYLPSQIIEMDWNESALLNYGFTIYCLPSRHFSGRTFKSNQTLWASYMVQTPSQTIYLSGDGGYGSHYSQIAAKFPNITIAIMENGQYNEDWSYIHLMPEDFKKALIQLNPKLLFAGHNGKYALSKHPWSEPLDNVADLKCVIMPIIGEIVHLQDSVNSVNHWWKSL